MRTVVLVLLVAGMVYSSAIAKYGGGSGEPNDPYLIYDANHMQAIGADANDWAKHFKLMADIDLAQFDGKDGREKFHAIGTWDNPFTGVFDGNDHTIANFTCDSNDRRTIGLFGYIDAPKVEIKDLGLVDSNVDAVEGFTVGSLVGDNRGTISNCYVDGGSVMGNTGASHVGGLVGISYYGKIIDCHFTGSISGYISVGGLVGYNQGTITNSYATCNVSGYMFEVGGLVGYHCGTITNCYFTGSVVGDYTVGGLVGTNETNGEIKDCYARGNVIGRVKLGGLVGCNRGEIAKCYSIGNVDGNDLVGGVVGDNSCLMEACGTITNSYWDIETSGESNMCGLQEGGATGCDPYYGKTTVELHLQSTFQNWDFINVWNIGENQTYPYLRVYLPSDINQDGIVNFLDIAITANQWMQEQ